MSKVINHISHGMGPARDGVKGTIATTARGKAVHEIAVHDAMRTRSAAGDALGGTHKSYLDSLTGATVPGASTTAPGWGSGTVRSGNPMAHAPAGKTLRQVPVHPSQSKGAAHDQQLAELGRAILREAVKN